MDAVCCTVRTFRLLLKVGLMRRSVSVLTIQLVRVLQRRRYYYFLFKSLGMETTSLLTVISVLVSSIVDSLLMWLIGFLVVRFRFAANMTKKINASKIIKCPIKTIQ